MSLLNFRGVGISAISACVPKHVIKNKNRSGLMTDKEVENAMKTTGIYERRFADDNTCASDLCYEAALRLMEDLGLKKNSVDLLIFLSQTPDYHQPATAPILQNRLGLPKTTAAFDINLACSGYVYGLSTAFSYATQEGINRVLLLVGETLSKILSMEDRATSLLFGDGGTATLIEKNEKFPASFFSLNSDGSGDWILKVPAGGYRSLSSEETVKKKTFPDGSLRSDENLFMDGMEVFNFSMREVPDDIKKTLKYAEQDITEVDYLIFHQANKYMTDFLAKKLQFPREKVPYSLQNYGNTSAVSIPLTIGSELKNQLKNRTKKVILSGFGGGLSWGTALLTLTDCHVSEIVEY